MRSWTSWTILTLCWTCGLTLRLPAAPRRASEFIATVAESGVLEEQRRLFEERKARLEGAASPQSWSTKPTRAVLDGLFRVGWQPQLKPDPLPVVELDGALDAEALARLLRHDCCAVVVRGFVDAASCRALSAVLRDAPTWQQWKLNGDAASDVDKAGLVSSEALQSFDAFRQCAASPPHPASQRLVRALVPIPPRPPSAQPCGTPP